MSHDATGKIMADSNGGVDVRGDVAYVLGRNTGDVGQLCSDKNSGGTDVGAIDKWSLHKPFRANNVATTLADKQAAKYGWSLLTKGTGSGTTSSFLTTIFNMGEQTDCWTYNKPRGLNGGGTGSHEHYRILDFDGYKHTQKPYAESLKLNRLTSYELAISGTYRDGTIPANMTTAGGWEWTYTSESFSLTGAFDGIFKFRLTSPIYEYEHYYVEGGIDIYLKDSNNRTVASWSDIFSVDQTGGTLQTLTIPAYYDGSLDEYSGVYYIYYRVLIDVNTTYHEEVPGYPNYDAVDFQMETTYAASLAEYYQGTKGVTVQLSTNLYDGSARTALFGSNAINICCVQVSNGTTTQRKIIALDTSSKNYIPFKKIGITIEPRASTSANDVVLYLFLGDYHMFPNFSWVNNYYGDISLADNYSLTAYPHALAKLGTMPEPPQPMIVDDDDFQGAEIEFQDGTTETISTFNSYGLTHTRNNIDHLHFEWGFVVENAPEPLTAIVTLHLVYDWGAGGWEELLCDLTYSYNVTAHDPWDSFVASFDYYYSQYSSLGRFYPFEIYAKLWIEIDGTRYYVDMPNSRLQETDPGYQPLGDD